MSNDNKKIFQETSRWMRVGFLTISVLGPVVETLASRLRQRSAALHDEAAKRGSVAYQQSQERLAATGATLADTVDHLRDESYRQELLKRSGDLTGDFVDRGTKLTQVAIERGGRAASDFAERGSKATQVAIERGSDALQDLTERSEKASRELAKRTERVSKDITKRGKRASKEVTKRSQRASRELQKRSQAVQHELAKRTEQLTRRKSQQNNPFFLIFGFSISLVAAGIAVYLLVRRRLDQHAEQSQHMHLVQNPSLNGSGMSGNSPSAEPRRSSQATTSATASEVPATATPSLAFVEPDTEPTIAELPLSTQPELEESESATEKMPIISIQGTVNAQPASEVNAEAQDTESVTSANLEAPVTGQTDTAIPVDAKFLGIVATKTYYPIETPLDTLPTSETGTPEVIYFVSTDEALAQGYVEAE